MFYMLVYSEMHTFVVLRWLLSLMFQTEQEEPRAGVRCAPEAVPV